MATYIFCFYLTDFKWHPPDFFLYVSVLVRVDEFEYIDFSLV